MKDKAFLGASVLAALVASFCCILPLVFALAGITAVGASGLFAAWRPYLLGLTLLLLAAGFYFSYRRPRQACEPGAVCEHPTAGRFGRLGLWIATGVVVLFAAFPYYSAPLSRAISRERATATVPAAYLEHATFAVEGMSCPLCAEGVEHQIKRIPGVQHAAVSFEQRKAQIDFDPKLVTLEQLEKPFADAGYKAKKL